jgi:hypothetical protein
LRDESRVASVRRRPDSFRLPVGIGVGIGRTANRGHWRGLVNLAIDKGSTGEYEVHDIGVNWPHHIFVNANFTVAGANWPEACGRSARAYHFDVIGIAVGIRRC